MDKMNVGIVGCGYVANDHLKAWKRLPQTQVLAVSDLNEALAKNTAESWRIPHHYSSLYELLRQNKIDIVDICTPPQTHARLAVEAMSSGANVLLEKPMSMTVEDAKKIVDCRKSTGMRAGVIHNWLFEPPILEANSLVERGSLGEVVNIEIEALNTKYDPMVVNKNHWSHNLTGGRFSEMLAHPIYLIRHFLGANIEVCDLQVAKKGSYEWMKSDELCSILKVENKMGRTYASFNAPRDAIFINIYGKDAMIKLDLINSTLNLLRKRKTDRVGKGFDTLRQAAQILQSTAKNGVKIALGRWRSGHELCIELFVDSLVGDKEPVVKVEDGLAVVEILEKMCIRISEAEKTS
ncbi:Gfo/Idh/MocA family oxidoreductase [Candidatus Bathyarchaeota archaeon]|nr:Gfo/Idh/MocA family oxidoreductase [Candidatus Bathyarchaeota archaeon]